MTARPVAFLLLAAAVIGCEKAKDAASPSVTEPPTVKLTAAEVRTITRTVAQPSFVEAYERTSVYPKMTAYIEKWVVDIGDKVKKGDTLATLFVPELREDWETKKFTVTLDEQKVDLANKMVAVADADVAAAKAKVDQAKADVDRFQSDADRWDSEVKRLQKEVDKGVVDPQVLLESKNQFKQSTAARDAAKATVAATQADLLSKQAALAQAQVNVGVNKAAVSVAQSDARRLQALVGYLTLTAPFDGIITARNANTGDFVLPATGDPTADRRAPDLSPSGSAAPIFVVDRTDVVRVFVDVPEADANYVHKGAKASVLIRAYRDKPIAGTVTRTSWALNVKSRTLRAEIDLPSTDGKILPGMYAYGSILIQRPGVRAVPADALVHVGDRTFVWRFVDGKAVRTEVRTGVSDGDWVEVTDHRPAAADGDADWAAFDGTEQVILGDLSVLSEGGAVKVAK